MHDTLQKNFRMINIMLIYSNSEKLNIFIEYINGLIKKNDIYKVWSFGEKIEINDEHKIIMFMQIIPNNLNNIIFNNTEPITIVVCNTEQLSHNCSGFIFNIEPFFEFIKKQNNINFLVCDYSQQNVNILKKHTFIIINNIKVLYLPYQYNETEVNFLKNNFTKNKKIYTCGCQSDRRKDIIANLFDNGIKVDVVSGFYNIRDTKMMKYKIMLNLNAKDDYLIYEHIRCDRLIFAKQIIISEHKLDEKELDIYDFVIWCDKEEIEEKIKDVLKNYDEYVAKITDEKLNKIFIDRKKKYDELLYECMKN